MEIEVSGSFNLLNEVNEKNANNYFPNFGLHVENHKLPYFTLGYAQIYETKKSKKYVSLAIQLFFWPK